MSRKSSTEAGQETQQTRRAPRYKSPWRDEGAARYSRSPRRLCAPARCARRP